MKKIYLLVMMIACASFVFAQTPTKNGTNNHFAFSNKGISVKSIDAKAVGDTLMYCDGTNIFIDPTDQPTFAWNMEDNDGLTVDPTMAGYGWGTGWMHIYDDISVGCTTPDTCWWFGATSWFSPVGQADNWIEFGPVTIPATGGRLNWDYEAPDQANSDGYKVWVSTSGMAISDLLAGTNIYTRTDNQAPTIPDTLFNNKNASLAAWAGQSVYIGFQHNANNMFIIYFDNFLVTEQNNVGVNELNAANATIFSNNKNIYVNVSQVDNGFVSIYDRMGQLVKSVSVDKANMVINMNDVASGIYMVNVKIGDKVFNKKVIL